LGTRITHLFSYLQFGIQSATFPDKGKLINKGNFLLSIILFICGTVHGIWNAQELCISVTIYDAISHIKMVITLFVFTREQQI
jgi:uncharacterized membrane protein YqaE (UPF0057 family)